MPVTPAELTTDPLVRAVRETLAPGRFDRLGVAVSGGGDSVALLLLVLAAQAQGGPAPLAVSVDHGLRPESAAEAEAVARLCAGLGVPHVTLRWQDLGGWDGQGNLQDRARQARHRLIAAWARAEGLPAVALGHTADDQAETLLLRLARGSGVDGLAAMAVERQAAGLVWLRPMLGLRRAALRDWLAARDIGWIDDPSNDNPRFDRVRARQALALLAPLGLTVEGLVDTAARMAMARAALEAAAASAAARLMREEAGDLLVAPGWTALPEETRLRLLSAAMGWIAGQVYRPRLAALRRVLDSAAAGRAATLAGCLLLPGRAGLRLTREPKAVADTRAAPGAPWDGRWRLSSQGTAPEGAEIRALGQAGLALCPGWRATGRPHAALAATPAVWAGDELLAAPLAGWPGPAGAAWRAERIGPPPPYTHSAIVD